MIQFAKLGIAPKWAIAGRSRVRLEALQREWHVPSIVLADIEDQTSLLGLASRTRLLLNATGPYRFFGEPVVRACIEAGTDYIDLCGEPEFMERMLLLHHDAATQAGVLICHACAFDSIPADMGILRCAQLFLQAGGECASVELIHSVDVPMGYCAHDTTFKAAVHGMGSAHDLRKLRNDIDAKFGAVPLASTMLGKLVMRGQVSSDAKLGKYLVPFIGSDASVVRASRRMMSNVLAQPGAEQLMPQFGIYFGLASTLSIVKVLMGGAVFRFLADREWGRNALLRNPSLFTFGAFSEIGPTEEQMRNNTWIGDYFAEGLVAGELKRLHLQGRLGDPAYVGTSLLFAVVAETLLQDRGSLAAGGGVFTPAALFSRSSLLERLSGRGFELRVVESDLPGVTPR